MFFYQKQEWEKQYLSHHIIGKVVIYTQKEIHVMRLHIELGSIIHINITVNKYSDTPLHLAYCHRNKAMIDFLIQNGADENTQRYNGEFPRNMV